MSALEAIWWRPRPAPLARVLVWLLSVPELLYRAAVALRAALYRTGALPSARAAVPVISVGNVAVGGAGKTPVALAIASRLAAAGRRVAILSRGYGATRTDPRTVSDGERVLLGADEGGDEPLLLARRLPGVRVLCGPRRAALLPLAAGADVLLLDDGFQHRALARDLDVVVLDASSPFGNGHLLPAGPNREPRRALRRAGLVWLTRVDQADPEALEALRSLAREATGRPPVESRHAVVDVVDGTLTRSLGRDALRGARVALLSGIARPASFRRTVEALGAVVVAEHRFPDHHRFAPGDVERALGAAESVVTTEKDAVRLPPALAASAALRVVRIEAEVVRGGEALDEALASVLTSAPASPPTPASSRIA